MAFDDDDNPLAPTPGPAAADGTADEDAADDSPFDMRLFTSMFNKKGIGSQSIRKGQKDFESHGTKAQENALETSRQVIEEVLGYTRVHKESSGTIRGWYFPDYWVQTVEEEKKTGEPLWFEMPWSVEDSRSQFLQDRVAVVEELKGSQSKSVGRVIKGLKGPRPAAGKTWLLPEEALFLVERGSMDFWWPFRDLKEIIPAANKKEWEDGYVPESEDEAHADPESEEDEFDVGLPLSLQAAYSLLIGEDGERGKITLPKYQVYAHLKRAGFYVQRAPLVSTPPDTREHGSDAELPVKALWQWLFSFLDRPHSVQPYGPLVRPGFYRQYSLIYKQLELVPRHQTPSSPQPLRDSEEPFKVHWHIWKPSTNSGYTKSNPPPPDFRIAVVDARDTSVPTIDEMRALFSSVPLDLPNPAWKGPGRMFQRLKHGHRNVLLGVVDRGLVNFLRFGEPAFGEEILYERFDSRGSGRGGGGKRGGRGGRGGSRGRGGRGGRGGR